MSTHLRATQMHAGKYIRFDSTQELHTRLMSAKRRDYRIIARARAPIIEWRQRSRTARGPAPTRAHARATQARSGSRACAPIPALPMFSAYFRGSMRYSACRSLYSRNCSQAPLTVRRAMRLAAAGRIKSKRRAHSSQSNFSSSPSSHFCRWDVANAGHSARNAPRIK